jgi:hypothetical protein
MRLPFLKKAATASEPLVVSMTGARLGDPVAFWGSNPALAVPLAARVGLSGRALAVGPSARSIESAAMKEGVLVEAADGFPADGSFDLAVVETTSGWEQAADAAKQAVRPGGRVVVVSGAPMSGLRALFGSAAESSSSADAIVSALTRAGWQRARAIGAREGMTFVEAFR